MTGDGLARAVTEPHAEIGPQAARVLLLGMEKAERWYRQNGLAPPPGWEAIARALSEVALAGGMHPMPIRSAPAVESAVSFEDPITPTQAACILDITERGARDLCARGTLGTAQRRPGGWVVERAEVLARAADRSGQRASAPGSGEVPQ